MRLLRWGLFLAAAAAFLRFTLFSRGRLASLAALAVCGGLWYWLQLRKMRELDGPERP